MTVLDVESAAKFLKVSTKTARALMARLPHGDVSRTPGPNSKLVIAQEILEKFVLGEIEPEPVGQDAKIVALPKPRRKKIRYSPPKDGPIPKRPYAK